MSSWARNSVNSTPSGLAWISSLAFQHPASSRTWTLMWTHVKTSTSMPAEAGWKRTSSPKPAHATAPSTSSGTSWRLCLKVPAYTVSTHATHLSGLWWDEVLVISSRFLITVILLLNPGFSAFFKRSQMSPNVRKQREKTQWMFIIKQNRNNLVVARMVKVVGH